jgi:hypothetical protein
VERIVRLPTTPERVAVTYPRLKGGLKAGLSPPASRRWVTRVSLGRRPHARLHTGSRPRSASSTGLWEGRTADKPGVRHETVSLKCTAGCALPGPYGPLRSTKLAVFVLDKRKKVLTCSKERARLLLTRGRAVVQRRYRFTIRSKDRQRLFPSGRCRHNQHQVLQTSPSRGQPWRCLRPALPPPVKAGGLSRGRLG